MTRLSLQLDEAAGFVAALSRFLNYPQGEAHRRPEVEILSLRTEEGVDLFLSDAAAAATMAAFGGLPSGPLPSEEVPHAAVRTLRGSEVTPMGIVDALALLNVDQDPGR